MRYNDVVWCSVDTFRCYSYIVGAQLGMLFWNWNSWKLFFNGVSQAPGASKTGDKLAETRNRLHRTGRKSSTSTDSSTPSWVPCRSTSIASSGASTAEHEHEDQSIFIHFKSRSWYQWWSGWCYCCYSAGCRNGRAFWSVSGRFRSQWYLWIPRSRQVYAATLCFDGRSCGRTPYSLRSMALVPFDLRALPHLRPRRLQVKAMPFLRAAFRNLLRWEKRPLKIYNGRLDLFDPTFFVSQRESINHVRNWKMAQSRPHVCWWPWSSLDCNHRQWPSFLQSLAERWPWTARGFDCFFNSLFGGDALGVAVFARFSVQQRAGKCLWWLTTACDHQQWQPLAIWQKWRFFQFEKKKQKSNWTNCRSFQAVAKQGCDRAEGVHGLVSYVPRLRISNQASRLEMVNSSSGQKEIKYGSQHWPEKMLRDPQRIRKVFFLCELRKRPYTSAMLQSWNKFCLTGGVAGCSGDLSFAVFTDKLHQISHCHVIESKCFISII